MTMSTRDNETVQIWQLGEKTIREFSSSDTRVWMEKIMSHLFKVLDGPTYDKIAKKLVLAARKNVAELKKVLITAVAMIKEARQKQFVLVV